MLYYYKMVEETPKKKKLAYLIAGGIGSIALMSLLITQPRVSIINEGEVGVRVTLGKVKDEPVREGIVIYSETFEDLYKFSTRVEKVDFREALGNEITALTKDGLNVKTDITVLYRINPEKAPDLYKNFGTNYVEKIITPQVRSKVRDIASNYTAEDLYTPKRREFQKKIEEEVRKEIENFSKNYLVVESVLLRNIKLPREVEKSIEEKIKAKQEAEKMNYILQREKLESERKIIEAKGIAEANKIIAESLTREYLNWYYIQTLKEISKNSQSTTVIIPYDINLVPMLDTKNKNIKFMYQKNMNLDLVNKNYCEVPVVDLYKLKK